MCSLSGQQTCAAWLASPAAQFASSQTDKLDNDPPSPPALFISADGQRHKIYFLEKHFPLEGNRIKSIFALSTEKFSSNFQLPNKADQPIEVPTFGKFFTGSELRGGGEGIHLTIDALSIKENKIDSHTGSAFIAILFQKHVECFLSGDIRVTASTKQEEAFYASLGFVPSEEELERLRARRVAYSTAATQDSRSDLSMFSRTGSYIFFKHPDDLAPLDLTHSSFRLDRTYSSAALHRILSGIRPGSLQSSSACNNTLHTLQQSSSHDLQDLSLTQNSVSSNSAYSDGIEMVLPPRSTKSQGSRDFWQTIVLKSEMDAQSLTKLQGVYDKAMAPYQE